MGPFLFLFKNKSPSSSVVAEDAAFLFCSQVTEMFRRLQHFIRLLISIELRSYWLNFIFWANCSFKLAATIYSEKLDPHVECFQRQDTGMISGPRHGYNWNTKNYIRRPTIFTSWLETEAGLWVANNNTLSSEPRHASSRIINRISSILRPSTSHFHSSTMHSDQKIHHFTNGMGTRHLTYTNIWVLSFLKEFGKNAITRITIIKGQFIVK